MSDGPHHPIAHALQTARDEAAVRARMNGPMGGGGGGGGIGNLSGWVVFFGMIGAIIGGILGRGFLGAIFGALFFAVVIWGISAFLGSSGGSAISRFSVLKWVLMGAFAGVVMAWLISLEYPDRMENLLTNWVIIGAIAFGGFRLIKRGRG
jgi:hypothetical protein